MKRESQPAGATYGGNNVEQFGFMPGGQSTGTSDVHRANGTLPADRYAEYVSGMAHRVIG